MGPLEHAESSPEQPPASEKSSRSDGPDGIAGARGQRRAALSSSRHRDKEKKGTKAWEGQSHARIRPPQDALASRTCQ